VFLFINSSEENTFCRRECALKLGLINFAETS
jgi:hypothetical protein